jgi:hypothetical protein
MSDLFRKQPSERLIGVAILISIGTLIMIMSAGLVTACSPTGRTHTILKGLDVARCVLEHQGEDEAKVIALCAVENVSPDDVRRMIADAQTATAKANVKAGISPCGGK